MSPESFHVSVPQDGEPVREPDPAPALTPFERLLDERQKALEAERALKHTTRPNQGGEPIGRNTEKGDVKREETTKVEDIEVLSRSLRSLSQHLEEFSDTLVRNKFSRAQFDSEDLIRAVSSEMIDQEAFSRELKNLSTAIDRIGVSEGEKGMLVLETYNITAVSDGMENIATDLLKLKSGFEKARSENYDDLARETNRVLSRIRSKKDSLDDMMRLLLRYKGR